MQMVRPVNGYSLCSIIKRMFKKNYIHICIVLFVIYLINLK